MSKMKRATNQSFVRLKKNLQKEQQMLDDSYFTETKLYPKI